jgi:ATP-binding cassette subfamily B (MDR/TAP) protein 1
MRTAERQTYCIRKEYLKAILRQEVGFFDNKDASSTTFEVVSTISSDAHFIQDTIAEKVFDCLRYSFFFFFFFFFFLLC